MKLSIANNEVVAGDAVRVDVDRDAGGGSMATVRLEVLERTKANVRLGIDADARVLSEVPLAASASSVDLPTPAHLPAAADFDVLSWAYQVSVTDGRGSRRVTMPIDLRPSEAIANHGDFAPNVERFDQRRYPTWGPPTAGGAIVVLLFVMFGLGLAAIGVVGNTALWARFLALVSGLAILGVCLALAFKEFSPKGKQNRAARASTQISVYPQVVMAGEDLAVTIDAGSHDPVDLKVRLVAEARWPEQRGGTRKEVSVRYRNLVEGDDLACSPLVRIPTPHNGPAAYVGVASLFAGLSNCETATGWS